MVKHTQKQTLLPTNSLSLLDHFVGLVLKELLIKVQVRVHRRRLAVIVTFEHIHCKVYIVGLEHVIVYLVTFECFIALKWNFGKINNSLNEIIHKNLFILQENFINSTYNPNNYNR